MNTKFSNDELARYQRHFQLNKFGSKGQQQLRQARVLCIGAGGLGSPTLLYLAAAGIGTLGIIDADKVEISNLQRQVLYSSSQAGDHKVQAAKQHLQALNPHVSIITYPKRLQSDNAFEIIEQYDIVVDGSDNFQTRYLVNDVCYFLKIPLVFAAISQFNGQCSVFTFDNSPCYRCLFPSPPPPGLINNCAEDGVLGVLPGVMGTIQATEVIKLIIGLGDTLCGRLLTYDALKMNFNSYSIAKRSDCLLCSEQEVTFADLPRYENENICMSDQVKTISTTEFKSWQQKNKPHFLLDVRERYEYAAFNIGGSNIPLAELEHHATSLPRDIPIVVCCHSGVRSHHAIIQLQQQAGLMNTLNLAGGVAAF